MRNNDLCTNLTSNETTSLLSSTSRDKMKLLMLFCVLGSLYVASYSGPIHASCNLTWDFSLNCSAVQSKLVAQVQAWNNTNCPPPGKGEKCRYALVSQSESKLETTHTTPQKHYVDDQTMTFKVAANGGCTVTGYSTSETWYAVLDYGTNYCNLHNLVTGSGLDMSPGFKETAEDSTCTQYSSSKCDVY